MQQIKNKGNNYYLDGITLKTVDLGKTKVCLTILSYYLTQILLSKTLYSLYLME